MEICVFGAASKTIDKKYIDAVEEMGEYLANRGHNLVFGAGCTGSMGAAERGFKKGGGIIHGVVPSFFKGELSSFVDWKCDKLTLTKTMRERKAIMESEADCFIITPGGIGTFEEFFEVLTLKQLGRHSKPIAIFNIDGYYDRIAELLDYSVETGFIKTQCKELYGIFDSIEEIADYIENNNVDYNVEDLK